MDGQENDITSMEEDNNYCGSCNGVLYPQTIDCMCCEKFFHRSCVGLDDTTEEEDEWWLCDECSLWIYGSQEADSDSDDSDSESTSSSESRNTTSSKSSGSPTNVSPCDSRNENISSSDTSNDNTSSSESSGTENCLRFNVSTAEIVNQRVVTPANETQAFMYHTKPSPDVNNRINLNNINQDTQQNSSTISQVMVHQNPRMSRGQLNSKSRSVSSKASSVIDLTLQRIDEERQLKEKRDKEYLDQKYSVLQSELEQKCLALRSELEESDNEDIYQVDLVNNLVTCQSSRVPGCDQNDRVSKCPDKYSPATDPVKMDQQFSFNENLNPNQRSLSMSKVMSTTGSSFSTTIPENISQIGGGYGSMSNDPGMSAVPENIIQAREYGSMSNDPGMSKVIPKSTDQSSVEYGSMSNDPGVSTIISVQRNTDPAVKQQTFGFSNYSMSRPQNHVLSSNYFNNITSSSSNGQVLSSEANYPSGITNPIMSSIVHGSGWNSQAKMPDMSVSSDNYFQQTNETTLSGVSNQNSNVISTSGFSDLVAQSRVNNATVLGGGFSTQPQVTIISSCGGFKAILQPQMDISTSVSGVFYPMSKTNASSIPLSGGNRYENASVPIVCQNGSNVNINVPLINANKNDTFTTFKPQLGFVPPAHRSDSGSDKMVPSRMSNGFGYQNISIRTASKDKKLKFSVRWEDLPLFESEFFASSRLCGYTDGGNRLRLEGKYVHKQGGFEIKGILSTSRKVLDAFGEDCKTSAKILEIESSTVTERILAMLWDVESCLSYLLKYTKIREDVLSEKRRPTKPFFLVYLKIVKQETWISNLPSTDKLYEKWSYWLKYLPRVESIKVPRLYSKLFSPEEPESIELHNFVDASENPYTTVSYLRIISVDQMDVALVGAKTKVASKQIHGTDQTEEMCEEFKLHLAPMSIDSPTSIDPKRFSKWERLVRAQVLVYRGIQFWLAKIRKESSYEMLRSLLMEVMNIVNSRPLTFVSIDSAEQEAITPNHLLVGSSSGSKKNSDWDASSSALFPSGDYKEDAKIIGRNWRISQQRANLFWKRWVKSYLPTLTRRTKWLFRKGVLERGLESGIMIGNFKKLDNSYMKQAFISTSDNAASLANLKRRKTDDMNNELKRLKNEMNALDKRIGNIRLKVKSKTSKKIYEKWTAAIHDSTMKFQNLFSKNNELVYEISEDYEETFSSIINDVVIKYRNISELHKNHNKRQGEKNGQDVEGGSYVQDDPVVEGERKREEN